MQDVSESTSLNKGSQGGWWRRKWNAWFPAKHSRLVESIDAEELLESGVQAPVVIVNQESKLWNVWYVTRWALPGGTGWKVFWAGLMAALIAGGPAFLAKFWGGTLTTLPEKIAIGLAMAIPVPIFMITFVYTGKFKQALENLRDDSAKLDLMKRLLIQLKGILDNQNNALLSYRTFEKTKLAYENNPGFTLDAYSEFILPEQDRLTERTKLSEVLILGDDLKKRFRSHHLMLTEFRNIMAIMGRQCDVVYSRYYEKPRSKFAYVLVAGIEVVGGMVSTFGLPIFAMILNENALPFDGVFFTDPNLAPYNGVAIAIGVIAALGSLVFNTIDKRDAYRDCKALTGKGGVVPDQDFQDNKTKINANKMLLKDCKDAHERNDNWVRFFNKDHAPAEVLTVEPKNSLTLLRYRNERQFKTIEQGDVYTGRPGSSVLASSGRPHSYQHGQVDTDEDSSVYANY